MALKPITIVGGARSVGMGGYTVGFGKKVLPGKPHKKPPPAPPPPAPAPSPSPVPITGGGSGGSTDGSLTPSTGGLDTSTLLTYGAIGLGVVLVIYLLTRK